jgi:phospholipase/carboxylesterase
VLTANETELVAFHEWTLRVRPPSSGNGLGLIVLLHGWTGNEDVMWVFAHKLPRDRWVISPRGPIPADGGYGWTPNRLGIETPIDDFLAACASLNRLISVWEQEHALPPIPADLVGFSQGAALAYSFSLIYPEKIDKVAGLAGFLPSRASRYFSSRPLSGKHVLIAHGTRDETVPIQAAEEAVRGLELAGARVDYCVSDVGHKLGSACLHALDEFFIARG